MRNTVGCTAKYWLLNSSFSLVSQTVGAASGLRIGGARLLDEHAIAVGIKTVAARHRVLVSSEHFLRSSEGAHQHQQRRLRQMKIRKQSLDDLKFESRVDEEIGFSAAGKHLA